MRVALLVIILAISQSCSSQCCDVLRGLIVIGQSNEIAYGCNDNTNSPTSTDVEILNIGVNGSLESMQFGVNTGGRLIGGTVLASNPSIGVLYADLAGYDIVLKLVVGSTQLAQHTTDVDWNINSIGELYHDLLLGLNQVSNELVIRGQKVVWGEVLWNQFEADVEAGDLANANAYFQNLTDFALGVNSHIGYTPNWAIVRASPVINAVQFPFWATARAAQDNFAATNSWAKILNMDDCNMIDNAHFDCDCIFQKATELNN